MNEKLTELRRRGVALHREGRLEEARSLYERLLKETPADAGLLELSGVLAAQTGRPVEALARFERALELEPGRASTHENLGNLHQSEDRLSDAVAAYERAAELAPGSASVHYNLGTALGRAERYQEAARAYERALELDDGLVAARCNLAKILGLADRLDDAERLYREAMTRAPEDPDPLVGLGQILRQRKLFDQAAEAYREALELDPSRTWLRHFIAAYSGETSSRPPEGYVPRFFDGFAEEYDDRLELLDFRAPARLGELVGELQPSGGRFRRALDLGCGTGLSGAELRPMVDELWGIDQSSEMLARARERGVYDHLEPRELAVFLGEGEESFDLFVASDVFVYLGDLEPIFTGVRSRARQDALFAFTTEISETRDFVLRKTARYAHSLAYLERLAEASDFAVVHKSVEPLRFELEEMLGGHFLVLRVR